MRNIGKFRQTSESIFIKEGINKNKGNYVVDSSSQKSQPGLQDYYVLAMIWQATSCELDYNYPECHMNHLPSLTLHGLWPSKKTWSSYYMNCESKFGYTPELSNATMTALHTIMPSTNYNDNFLDHEWVKHGTCMGEKPEDYFQDAIKIFDSINGSSFVDFIYDHNGETVTVANLYDAFDKSFGDSAHQHLYIKYQKINNGYWLEELRVALKHPLEFKNQQVILDSLIYKELDESMDLLLPSLD